jgi:hypothetical protein
MSSFIICTPYSKHYYGGEIEKDAIGKTSSMQLHTQNLV